MTRDLIWTCVFLVMVLILYRYHRAILEALKRFDQRNVARIAQELRDKNDPAAHFRHTMDVAGEAVEPVEEIVLPDSRTGESVTRYLFEAEIFASRDEAEQARAARVAIVARRFYAELPAALSGCGEPRSELSARERASQRWRRGGRTYH